MKANRKFIEADERAVSAVIGVILMVAITVAIAATVYVYVSGMIGGGSKRTPNISCVPNNTDNLLQITAADPDVDWTDINITIVKTNSLGVQTTGWDENQTNTVTAGDTIDVSSYLTSTGDRVAITIRYNPTNALVGTWNVS